MNPLLLAALAAGGLGVWYYEAHKAPAATVPVSNPPLTNIGTTPGTPGLPTGWTTPVATQIASPPNVAPVTGGAAFACPTGAPNVGMANMPEPFRTSIINARNAAALSATGAASDAALESVAQSLDGCGLTAAAADVRASKSTNAVMPASSPASIPSGSLYGLPAYACPTTVPSNASTAGVSSLPEPIRSIAIMGIAQNNAYANSGASNDAALEALANQLAGCGFAQAAGEVRSYKGISDSSPAGTFACAPASAIAHGVASTLNVSSLPDPLRSIVVMGIAQNSVYGTGTGFSNDAALEALAQQLDGCGYSAASAEVRSYKGGVVTVPGTGVGGGGAGAFFSGYAGYGGYGYNQAYGPGYGLQSQQPTSVPGNASPRYKQGFADGARDAQSRLPMSPRSGDMLYGNGYQAGYQSIGSAGVGAFFSAPLALAAANYAPQAGYGYSPVMPANSSSASTPAYAQGFTDGTRDARNSLPMSARVNALNAANALNPSDTQYLAGYMAGYGAAATSLAASRASYNSFPGAYNAFNPYNALNPYNNYNNYNNYNGYNAPAPGTASPGTSGSFLGKSVGGGGAGRRF